MEKARPKTGEPCSLPEHDSQTKGLPGTTFHPTSCRSFPLLTPASCRSSSLLTPAPFRLSPHRPCPRPPWRNALYRPLPFWRLLSLFPPYLLPPCPQQRSE